MISIFENVLIDQVEIDLNQKLALSNQKLKHQCFSNGTTQISEVLIVE